MPKISFIRPAVSIQYRLVAHTDTDTGQGEGRQLIPLYSIASSRCTFVELSIPTSFRFVFIVTDISKISF